VIPRVPRLGVLGVGSLGFHHARILRDLPGISFAGVFDTDAERLAQVSRELGVHAFASRQALLDAVDAAVVAVPTTRHAEVALAALDAGVHLLIEKPIASTLEEAERIVEAAERGACWWPRGTWSVSTGRCGRASRSWTSRGSWSRTGWRRSTRAEPTSPWCWT
jgi:NAD-dependent oxidoreductase involved in siderophore biosynthesis